MAGNETYVYESLVAGPGGQVFGDGVADAGTLAEADARRLRNMRYLQQEHGGALQVHIDLCRRAGMRFVPSYRMCEHYGAAKAVGEAAILLHPPPPSVGVSIGMDRGRQQKDRTLADG